MSSRLLLVVIVAGAMALRVGAQNPCGERSLVYKLRWPDRHPPVSIYMPYDVLVGYIALDSIINWATTKERQREVVAFLGRRTAFDDTLKKIVRSMYAMGDYDPMLYEATLWDFRYPQMPPYAIREYVMDAVNRSWGSDTAGRALDVALLRAHYIVHVAVSDTVHVHVPFNINGGISRVVVATCRVLDVVKGNVFPSCDPSFRHTAPVRETTLPNKLLRPLSNDRCLQFSYIPELPLSGQGCVPFLGDVFGDTIVPGRQYMVFLTYTRLCRGQDSSGDYWELLPIAIDLPTASEYEFRRSVAAYEIVNDGSQALVRIPNDEFGWGTQVPLATFEQRLRERIAQIRSW